MGNTEMKKSMFFFPHKNLPISYLFDNSELKSMLNYKGSRVLRS